MPQRCHPGKSGLSTQLRRWLGALGLGLVLLCGCGGGGGGTPAPSPAPPPPPPPPDLRPVISTLEPERGAVEAPVVLTGSNFTGLRWVRFGGVLAPVARATANRIETQVPPNAASGPVTVLTAAGQAESPRLFTVTAPAPAPPTLTTFAPRSGRAFTSVTLAGSGFTADTRVLFNGVRAYVILDVSDRHLTTWVPSGATSGLISVTTAAGTATSEDPFIVESDPPPDPVLASLSPAQGPVGTLLVLQGAGFFAVEAVTFGGTRAVPQVDTDDRLTVRVPEGAATGPVRLLTASGASSREARTFTVTQLALPAPVLTSFTPAHGGPGTRVEVSGQNLLGVYEATVGGRPVQSYGLAEHLLVLYLPTRDPVSGPILLTSSGGIGRSLTDFTVDHPGPSLTSMEPELGAPGTPVVFTGQNLGGPVTVTFGGIQAGSVQHASAAGFTVPVPEAAVSGPVTVTTATGSVTHRRDFTVTANARSLDLRITGLYLTQGSQRMNRSVPLVANRDAFLRVFVRANEITTVQPRVRVTLRDDRGVLQLEREIQASAPGVPLEIDEGDLQRSWNLALPGALLQPGSTLLARLLAPAGYELADPDGLTYPAHGRPLELNPRVVAPLGITLFSVESAGLAGMVTGPGRPADYWLTSAREFYPLDQVDLVVSPRPFVTNIVLGPPGAYDALVMALEDKRRLDAVGNRRHYVGVVSGWFGPFTGIGYMGGASGTHGRSALVWDGAGGTGNTEPHNNLAHELGHNFNRAHAPCGNPSDPDPNFPYSRARLGAFGFNVAQGQPRDPLAHGDIMGYCYPRAVSDYTYRAVLDRRAGEPRVLAPGDAPLPQPGLYVSGSIQDGVATLPPPFQVTQAFAAPEPGEYRLVCRDAAGAILLQVSFAPEPLADRTEPGERASFGFVIPMTPALQAALASLSVELDGRVLGVRGDTQAPSLLALPGQPRKVAGFQREPVATGWGPGRVYLGWDQGTHPKVMVREPGGEIIAFAEGGAINLATAAKELTVTFSDGLRSLTRTLQVQP